MDRPVISELDRPFLRSFAIAVLVRVGHAEHAHRRVAFLCSENAVSRSISPCSPRGPSLILPFYAAPPRRAPRTTAVQLTPPGPFLRAIELMRAWRIRSHLNLNYLLSFSCMLSQRARSGPPALTQPTNSPRRQRTDLPSLTGRGSRPLLLSLCRWRSDMPNSSATCFAVSSNDGLV